MIVSDNENSSFRQKFIPKEISKRFGFRIERNKDTQSYRLRIPLRGIESEKYILFLEGRVGNGELTKDVDKVEMIRINYSKAIQDPNNQDLKAILKIVDHGTDTFSLIIELSDKTKNIIRGHWDTTMSICEKNLQDEFEKGIMEFVNTELKYEFNRLLSIIQELDCKIKTEDQDTYR